MARKAAAAPSVVLPEAPHIRLTVPGWQGPPRANVTTTAYAQIERRRGSTHPDFVVTPVDAGVTTRGLGAPVFGRPTEWAWSPRPGGSLDTPRCRYGGARGYASYGEALVEAAIMVEHEMRAKRDQRECARRESRVERTVVNQANRILRLAGLDVRATRGLRPEARGVAAVPRSEPARRALVAAGWTFVHDDYLDDEVGYWGPAWASSVVGRKAARKHARGGR